MLPSSPKVLMGYQEQQKTMGVSPWMNAKAKINI